MLYGPPGTGKSLTCRYVMNQLPGVTCFIITGNQLHNIKQICEVALLLQPSLLVLEDVDLAFSSREINLYSTVLGGFMDLLDGMNDDDELMFLMTTNEIDKVEKAIKDRPGRVNQCLNLGYPSQEERVKFLELFLQGYDTSALDFPMLAKKIDRVSQVFIKELCRRAIRFAAKEANFEIESIRLENKHVERALEQITSQNDQYVDKIIGFR
jgi:SpoVK/Ycf46/Vps4 family AAA+-type ATPase